MTPSDLRPLTFDCFVNGERIEGFMTSDLSLFTTLMKEKAREGGKGEENQSQLQQ